MRCTISLPALLFVTSMASAAVRDAQPCGEVEAFHVLDFWVGEWDVYVGDQMVGHNRIEKALEGCVVLEYWTDARGNEGRSLFFYTPPTDTWSQVWVTDGATALGGVKQKTLVESFADGGVQFQGEIPVDGGGSYLDRTTLTPLEGGRVRQHIEISRDGETWESMFDAIYVRKR